MERLPSAIFRRISQSSQCDGLWSGHYIFIANPSLVINAIVKVYTDTLSDEQRLPVLERSHAYNLNAANEAKRREALRSHSEDDLNSWGYELMFKGEKQWALGVFKLNVEMHPASYNVYDSLAECYEALGDNVHAIDNYQRSLALNPKNSHATERLNALSRQWLKGGHPITHKGVA